MRRYGGMRVLPQVFALVVLVAGGCSGKKSGNDDLSVPYALPGMSVEFCPNSGSCETVGSVSGDYDQRDRLKDECRSIPFNEAKRRDLSDSEWSYVCCTQTKHSACATKVR